MLGSLDSRETRRLLNVDSYAVYSPAGYLLYLRGQTLMARPFDAKRFEFTGNPLTVADQVQPFLGHSVGGAFSTSEGSVLCYQKGVFVRTQMPSLRQCRERTGQDANDLTVVLHADHIFPSGDGGKTVLENLQILCQNCSLGKAKTFGKVGSEPYKEGASD